VDKLEILEEASVIASTSIEVVWQAPSKNSERILGFKVMVASSTGVVREAYQVWVGGGGGGGEAGANPFRTICAITQHAT
jgi:hypothetical protein